MTRLVHSLIDAQAQDTPEAAAVEMDGVKLSYAGLADRGHRIADGLRSIGLRPGDRVAYLGKNDPRIFELLVAASVGGFVLVPLNWRLSMPELRIIIEQSEAKLVLLAREFARLWQDVKPPAARQMALDDDIASLPFFDSWRDELPPGGPAASLDEDAVVLQLYTSGTTGTPKGVMITHRNLLGLRDPALDVPPWERPEADAAALVALPLFHVAGFSASLAMLCTRSGGCVIVMRDFNVAQVARLLEEDRVTRLCLVPTTVGAVIEGVAERACRAPRLRYVVYGASPMTGALLGAAMARFDADFLQLYGLTETSGYVTALSPEDHRSVDPQVVRSIGKPVPGVEMRIVDASGEEVRPGETGELWTRSPANMSGYFREREMTAKVLDGEGWFRTGDAGYALPSGHIVLQDRIKNLIISGGENIYPAEVENVLAACPGVADVAVVGIPDERWGEVPRAFVVSNRAGLASDHVLDWLQGRIASYKMPRSIAFVDALPRNASGKILHRVLRDLPVQR